MSQAMTSEAQTSGAAARREKIVQLAVQEVSQIATLPEITIKIVELVEDPDSTAQDLHLVISNDPALCARVLKVVNSAFYGLPGQIGSINRAIVLLGLNAVKNIAIAASLAKLFRGGRLCPSFSAKDLWTHSIAVASCTKLLAEKIRLGLPDEAFLGGLMHDIGVMVEMQAMRSKLVEAIELKEQQGITFLQAEEAVMGATHQDFGRALCQKWKFPRSFAYITGFHHQPLELDPASRTLTMLVHIADIVTARAGMGTTLTVPTQEIDINLLEELKLTAGMIDEVSAALPEAAMVSEQLLS